MWHVLLLFGFLVEGPYSKDLSLSLAATALVELNHHHYSTSFGYQISAVLFCVEWGVLRGDALRSSCHLMFRSALSVEFGEPLENELQKSRMRPTSC